MFQIDCPWCGLREIQEFSCGGEGHIVRPKMPSSVSDDEWADYVFMRKTPRGCISSAGCTAMAAGVGSTWRAIP